MQVPWGEYAGPVPVWLLEVAHYMDGPRWLQSLAGDISTKELFVAHLYVWGHMQTSSLFAAFPPPFLFRWLCDKSSDKPCATSPSKLLIGELSVFTSLQLITDSQTRGFDCPLQNMKMSHYQSISWKLHNPCQTLLIWSKTCARRVEEI